MCEWEVEGGKGLLLVAIKKVCAKEKLLVCKNGRFLKPARKGLCKRKFFIREKAVFEDSKKLLEQRFFGCENERLLRAKRKAVCKWKTFSLRKRTAFLAHTKPPDKEKLFPAHNDTDFALHQSKRAAANIIRDKLL